MSRGGHGDEGNTPEHARHRKHHRAGVSATVPKRSLLEVMREKAFNDGGAHRLRRQRMMIWEGRVVESMRQAAEALGDDSGGH